MNTNKKGDIGLVKTMMDLTVNGYFLFSPISDTTCVDLIAANSNMDLKRLQVKYRQLFNGALELVTSTVVNGKKIPVELNKIDIWAVYCPNNDKVYYIPTSQLIGHKSITLRVEKNKNAGKQIRMANVYENITMAWECNRVGLNNC